MVFMKVIIYIKFYQFLFQKQKKNITKKNIKYSIKKIFGYSINLNLIYANYYKYMKKYKYKKLPIPSNDNDIRFISKLSNIKFNTHNLDIDELSLLKNF